jgi:hypothetical protein
MVDLSYGPKGRYWVLGKSRVTKGMEKVILPGNVMYRFEIPYMGGTEQVTLHGPLTLSSLLRSLQDFYQEKVGRGRQSYVDLAEGDTIVGMSLIGSHLYTVTIQ